MLTFSLYLIEALMKLNTQFVINVLYILQEVGLLEEVISPRSNLPPLLLKLSERPAEQLDYLGVSYGLTAQLLRYIHY